jgi:hypothetical protein
MACRDARKILAAALKGEVLPATESERVPWEGFKPADAAARAARHEEAKRRGRRILLGTLTTDGLLEDWAWHVENAHEALRDEHWAEIKRRALDGDALCADVVFGVESAEAERVPPRPEVADAIARVVETDAGVLRRLAGEQEARET